MGNRQARDRGAKSNGTSSSAAQSAAAAKWTRVGRVSGGSLTTLAPLFTADGRYYLCGAYPLVRVYSTATGALVQTVDIAASLYNGAQQKKKCSSASHHNAMETAARVVADSISIAAMLFNPQNKFQLFVVLSTGWLGLYDFHDGALLKEWTALKGESNPTVSAAFAHPWTPNALLLVHCRQTALADTATTASSSAVAVTCIALPSAAGPSSGTVRTLGTQPVDMPDVSLCAMHPAGTFIAMSHGAQVAVVYLTAGVVSASAADSDGAAGKSRGARLFDGYPYTWSHDRTITALAINGDIAPGSSEDLALTARVATGDSRGQINVWTIPGSAAQIASAPHRTFVKLHWHAHAVGALCFSRDGEYLYSGGEEAVVVQWQLQTNHRLFLPRLGAGVKHLALSGVAVASHAAASPDQENSTLTTTGNNYIAVALSDNSLALVDGVEWKLVHQTIGLVYPMAVRDFPRLTAVNEGLRHNGVVPVPANSVFNVDGTVVCVAAQPCSLQFWDACRSRSVMQVDVSERARVRRTDSGVVASSVVQRVAFSPTADWMATVDVPYTAPQDSDDDGDQKMQLKFWRLNAKLRRYELVTRVDRPHTHAITDLLFSRGDLNSDGDVRAVTASLDGSFKVWSSVTPTANSTVQWMCTGNVRWRDRTTARAAAFSADNSVLAVVFDDMVTLWNPRGLLFSHVLAPAMPRQPDVPRGRDHRVMFVRSGTAHRELLVVWSATEVVCRDLLAGGKVCWSLRLDASGAAATVHLVEMVTGAYGPQLALVIDKRQPQPERIVTMVECDSGRCVGARAFADVAAVHSVVPIDGDRAVVCSRDMQISVFAGNFKTARPSALVGAAEAASAADKPSSMFSSMFGAVGATVKQRAPQAQAAPASADSSSASRDLWQSDVSAHAMPPVNTLLAAYFDTVLLRT